MGYVVHELCKDRSRTVTQANALHLAGDFAAEAEARHVVKLLDISIRETIAAAMAR
ncbi:hypothetical protein [Bradyrhizobium sp.]|uniref:hypothetical protein n=1 Tax=Bradyrhizobium sp. TaxID=376 RepID=UPI0039E333D7